MFDFADLNDDEPGGPAAQAIETDTTVFYAGDKVKGFFMKAQWYQATVQSDNGDGTYTLEWHDGDSKDLIKEAAEMRLIRRGPNAPVVAEVAGDGAQSKDVLEDDDDEPPPLEEAEPEEASAPASTDGAKEESPQADDETAEQKERAERRARIKRIQDACKKKEEGAQDEVVADPVAPAEADPKSQKADDGPEMTADRSPETVKERAVEDDRPSSEVVETAKATSEVADTTKDVAEKDAAQEQKERREKATQDQKINADYARKEREKRALERAGGRKPGVRAKIKEMQEKPAMNDACGTLVEEKGDRWVINLDGAPGVGKGKWLIHRKHLVVAQWNCSEPKVPYSIVGSWNNWTPADMAWDADRQCWLFTATLGDRGWESFQFIAEKDPNKCVHPDQKDATPHMPHKVCGPDFEGHGHNWSIGKHPLDKGRKGAVFEVRLFIWEDETPRLVEWSRPADSADSASPGAAAGAAKKEKYSITGTWSNWTPKDMEWDSDNQYYYYIVQLSSQGWESFQILLDGDTKRCIHPSISEANPYTPYTICGPDSRSHGKNWTIGRHALDKGSKGAKYKVRFFPAVGGRAALVDWEPTTGNATKPDEKDGARQRYCVAGTWGNWAPNDMTWDAKRRCYHYTVRLGLNGWESFQILVDGNYKKCIHPDCSDATPHETHNIVGPDSEGHGKNWTIGRHRMDLGSRGSRFEVKLFVDEEGKPKSVDWEKVPTPGLGH